MSKYSYYITRLSMSTLLKSLNAKPFIRLPAHRFIWGYDDNLYNLAKGVLAFTGDTPSADKFGILANVSLLILPTGTVLINESLSFRKMEPTTTLLRSTLERRISTNWEKLRSLTGTKASVIGPHKIATSKYAHLLNLT